jgi:hypothetical protein
MKKILLLLLFIFSISCTHAQNYLGTLQKFPELKYRNLTGELYYQTYKQTIGSAFLDDDYKTGKILLQNGEIIKDVKLKFDLFANNLIVYHDIKQQLIVIDKNTVMGFEIERATETEKYIRLQSIVGRSFGKDGCYVKVLTQGGNSLYKLNYREQLYLADPTDIYMYEFVDRSEYHLFMGDKDATVKLRRSTLRKFFPKYKVEMRKFIHQQKISANNEAGFSKVLQFINTLP